MADGRHFTDYRPRCMANQPQMHNEPLTSFEYRQYLIKNAESVMKNNSVAAYQANACGPCVEPFDVGTMLPEQYQVACSASTCKVTLNDQNGLGTGRVYSTAPTQEAVAARAEFMRSKDNEQAYFKKAAAVSACSGAVGGEAAGAAFPYAGFAPATAGDFGAPLAQ